MRARVPNKNSIDRKSEDLDKLLLLAENIQKYPCSYRIKYPLGCNPSTCGRWTSISKVLKMRPKSCKQRWKTLRKHFGLGLLTNKQLIDKLQFLKEVANETPASQLRNTWVSASHTLPTTKENSNLIIVPLVDSINGNEKNASKANEVGVTKKIIQEKNIADTKINEGYDSDLEIIEPYVETIEID